MIHQLCHSTHAARLRATLPTSFRQPKVVCLARGGNCSNRGAARCYRFYAGHPNSGTISHSVRRSRSSWAHLQVVASATQFARSSSSADRLAPKFDLALAVALAGTAFEAYLEPTGADGFQQIALNGSKITYTDRAFVARHFQGLLEVRVLRATDLPAADFTGKSDPYVVLSVGDSSAKSTFKFQTLDPEWNETFYLYVRDIVDDILKVRVYDKDFLDSDDDLGVVMYGLQDIKFNETMDLELELRGNGGGGVIHLAVTLLPFNGSLLDMLTPDDLKAEGLSGAQVPSLIADLKDRMNSSVESVESQDQESQQGMHSDADENEESNEAGSGWASSITWDQVQGILSNIAALKAKLPGGAIPEAAEIQAAAEAASKAKEEAGGDIAALDPALMPKAWKVLASVAGKQIEDHFMPVAFVENDATDTQVWVYQNTDAREVVIAFRGTEQVKWKDFVTDLNFTPCSLNPERVDSNAGLPFSMRLLAVRKQEEMVHMGFLTAYDSVKQQVLSLLEDIISGSTRRWRVYVTGHSLGGALATLNSYELAVRMVRSGANHHVCMYTFGAPRVGNAEFASNFRKFVPDSWRITNANDIIPTVPRLMGYNHVKRGVKLNQDGLLTFEDGSSDVFGEGRHTREVVEEILQKVQDEKWEEVYEAIQSAEMELLNLLVSGEALEQHMETFYLQTLRQCVLAYNPNISKEVLEVERLVNEDNSKNDNAKH